MHLRQFNSHNLVSVEKEMRDGSDATKTENLGLYIVSTYTIFSNVL